MAKKNVEVKEEEMDFTIDTEEVKNASAVSQPVPEVPETRKDRVNVASRKRDTDNLICCL
jgi:hypothetical protein